jgi:hypothetical protein
MLKINGIVFAIFCLLCATAQAREKISTIVLDPGTHNELTIHLPQNAKVTTSSDRSALVPVTENKAGELELSGDVNINISTDRYSLAIKAHHALMTSR